MRRAAEWTLFVGGACLVTAASWNLLRYDAFQKESHSPVKSSSAFASTARRILGRLEIPRLGLSTPILEDDDEGSLGLAAGLVPGTAALGTKGNTVIAGHRDTVFRALRTIRSGDRIQIEAGAAYEYVVQDIRIVSPDEISVLQSSDKPMLTLITC